LIRLKDGQTLVLSGIIRDSDRSTVQKIPFLGDIPLLGALFRRTETNRTRNEVIVLVTPRILDDSDSSNYGYQLSPDAQELLNKK
jgi:type IV pilus assembly protein PilQ